MRQENVKKAYWLARYINVAFQVPEATSPRLPRLITWLCPSASNMKLNTDGSARGDPGPAGYGGVFRDELYGYFRKLRDISSLEAEVWGIYKGLTIILENGLNGIDVEIRLGRNHETNPRG
ncbi:Ribonuclease H protein [Actinidia chinensis var. chinensis]|nr:Ribonuclease H protein [Actinidia chinensis var. chinensis]